MGAKLEDNPYLKTVQKGLKKINFRDYQKKWLKDSSRRRIALKSRQVGFSWLFGVEGAVTALLEGRNQLFASASQDQSDLTLGYARWFLTEILDIDLVSDAIGKIVLPNGTYLKALPKNWYTIQGFNGDVYFDEFAWNVDDIKIWRVLIPSITAVQGRVSVASTPFAKRGKFYDLWTGDNKYSKHHIDIYEAIEQGLDIKPFATAEEFVQDLMDTLQDPEFFPSAYECQFIDNKNSYIPFSLIEPLMTLYENEENGQNLWLGIDIGRHRDITDITAIGEDSKGKKEVRFNVHLEKTKYEDQKKFILQLFKKHKIMKCAIDRTGIGDNIYENIKDVHHDKVIGVWFTQKNKEKMAKNVKRILEDKEITLLKDRKCGLHYTAIKRTATERGFKYDTEKGGRTKEQGHADKFWSLALSLYIFYKRKRKMKTKRYGKSSRKGWYRSAG